MRKKTKSLPSSPLPLQESTRELQAWDPTYSAFSSTPFKLPGGWSMDERRRLNSPSHPGRVDKYCFEPGTGRQFRSLIAIRKHLSGEAKGAIMPRRVDSGNLQNMQIVPCTTKSGSSFGLADHWIVEERPRCVSTRLASLTYCILQYYIEPGAGLRFRSRITAERYIAQVGGNSSQAKGYSNVRNSYHDGSQDNDISDENHSLIIMLKSLRDAGKIRTKAKALKLGTQSSPTKKSGSQKKHRYGEEPNLATSDFLSHQQK